MIMMMTQNLQAVHTLMRTPVSKMGNATSKPSTPNDFRKLKEISDKLNLPTRRPSVVQWKQIIENRKSRGQYATSGEPQYLDAIAAQGLSDSDSADELNNCDTKCRVDNYPFSIIQEQQETPTKMSTMNPLAASVPTPIRRLRRIARNVIPEIQAEDCSRKTRESNSEGITNDDVSLSSTISSHSTISDINMEDVSKASLSSDTSPSNEDLNARYRNVTQAFEKIRRDLVIMRIEDNKLARKLLDVRGKMNLLRAQKSCEEHAEMLDDITYELEEEEELTGLIKACDLSDRKPAFLLSEFSPLRNIGVSRMNLNRRRFSIR